MNMHAAVKGTSDKTAFTRRAKRNRKGTILGIGLQTLMHINKLLKVLRSHLQSTQERVFQNTDT